MDDQKAKDKQSTARNGTEQTQSTWKLKLELLLALHTRFGTVSVA